MGKTFDPYYKWLGIPPEEQPPDHYRLLGIKRFEADPDVIEAAADKQAAYLRTCAGGRHADESQRLLNEIAAARICLLNPEKKREYDATLSVSTMPGPQAELPADFLGGSEGGESFAHAGPAGRRKGKSRQNAMIVPGIVSGTAAVVLLALWGLWPLAKEQRENPPASRPAAADATPPADSIAGSKPSSSKTDPAPASASPGASPADPGSESQRQTSAAHAVFRLGGSVKLDGNDQALSKPEELPRQPFQIVEVDVVGRMTDQELAPLAGLGNLREVRLTDKTRHDDKAGDGLIAHLSESKGLRHLELQHLRITGKGLAAIASSFPELEVLALWDTLVSDEDLKEIHRLRKLKILSISACGNITDQGLRQLTGLARLEHLHMMHLPSVTDAGFLGLADLPGLKCVVVSAAAGDSSKKGISDRAIAELKKKRPDCTVETPDRPAPGQSDVAAAPSPPTPSAEPKEPPARLPLPAEAARQEALKLAGELYREKYEAAKTAAEKRELAQKLVAQAAKESVKPAERFVLLNLAGDLSAKAADAATALRAADELAKSFEVDGTELKLAALEKCAKQARTSAEQKALVEQGRAVVSQALAEENADAALQASELLLATARKTRDAAFVKTAAAAHARTKQSAAVCGEAVKARARLRRNPDDPEANLAVGWYLCAVKEDWEQGLACLAKGDDAGLKAMASQEIGAPPADPEGQVKLGDAWWERAGECEGLTREAAYLRAGYWYKRALPNLAPGLVQGKIDKRLKEIGEIQPTGRVVAPQSAEDLPETAASAVRLPGKIIPERIDTEMRLARSGGPYKLMSRTLIVPPGRLLIERGTLVLATPGAAIIAEGGLNSYGKSEDFVKFRPGVPQMGWQGVELRKGTKHLVERFDIRGANRGVYLGEDVIAEIQDCLILGNKLGAETMFNKFTCWFRNCIIANNLSDGIVCHLNHVNLDHCTVANNAGVGMNMAYYGNLKVTSCAISGNRIGIQSNQYEAKLEMKSSNVLDNRMGAIEIKTGQEVQCRGNYWGTSNAQQIAAMILDGLDQTGRGVVRFEDFTTKPIADAGSSLRIPKRD